LIAGAGSWKCYKRVKDTTAEYFIFDGDNVLASYDSGGNLNASYLTPGLDANLSMANSTDTYYYFTDGLGSVRNVVESDEDVANTYDYRAFVVLITETENVDSPFEFTGRQREPGGLSHMHYYRNRYYMPGVGIFTSRDAFEYDVHQGWAYVVNEPTMMVDPHGWAYVGYTYDHTEKVGGLWGYHEEWKTGSTCIRCAYAYQNYCDYYSRTIRNGSRTGNRLIGAGLATATAAGVATVSGAGTPFCGVLWVAAGIEGLAGWAVNNFADDSDAFKNRLRNIYPGWRTHCYTEKVELGCWNTTEGSPGNRGIDGLPPGEPPGYGLEH